MRLNITMAGLATVMLCAQVHAERSRLSAAQPTPQPYYVTQTQANDNSSTISILPSYITTAAQGCTTVNDQKQTTQTIYCVLTGSGKIDPTCSLNITPAADPNDNGGHLHDAATRPLGTVAPSTGMGQITFVYSAPLASGTVNLVVTGVSSYGAAIAPYTYKMQVKTSGLQAMPPGGGYSLIGATGIHPDNHYGTPELITALQGLASDYAAAFPGSTLNYNDMALQEGGVFDLSSTWAPPHCGHRGDNADLDTSNIPADRRARVQALANHNGLAVRDEIRTANHYHLSR